MPDIEGTTSRDPAATNQFESGANSQGESGQTSPTVTLTGDVYQGAKPPQGLPRLENDYQLMRNTDGTLIEVGRGGMGVVYLGQNSQTRGPTVAIKICRDPQNEDRFIEEFDTLVALTGQGIPQPIGLYRNNNNDLCYAMSLVRGKPLEECFNEFHALSRGLNPIEETGSGERNIHREFLKVLGYFIDFAEIVKHVHQKGYLHRDLKPNNVVVEEQSLKSVLLDFGLARRSEDLTDEAQGTLAYMAPEQATGDKGKQGRHSDVYSLGAMLYHLVTGDTAIRVGNRPLAEVLAEVQASKFAPPTLIPGIRSDFPGLTEIILKAMKPDPQDRYPSVQALIDDLTAWQQGYPVKAYREAASWGQRMHYDYQMWSRQHPALSGGGKAVAVLSILLGGLFGVSHKMKQDNAAVVARDASQSLEDLRSKFSKELRALLGVPYRADESNSLTGIRIETLDTLIGDGRVEKLFEETLRELNEQELAPPVRRNYEFSDVASVIDRVSGFRTELQKLQKAYRDLAKQRSESRDKLDKFREELASIKDILGSVFGTWWGYNLDPQGSIDTALASFIEKLEKKGVSESESGKQGSKQGQLIHFPALTTEDIRGLERALSKAAFSKEEREEIKRGVAHLLVLRVMNLPTIPEIGFSPDVVAIIPTASEYLDLVDELTTKHSTEPHVAFTQLVLKWRIAKGGGSRDKADELRKEIAMCVRKYERQPQKKDPQLCIAVADWLFEHEKRYADALKAYKEAEQLISGEEISGYIRCKDGEGRCQMRIAQIEALSSDGRAVAERIDEAVESYAKAEGYLEAQGGDPRARALKTVVLLGGAQALLMRIQLASTLSLQEGAIDKLKAKLKEVVSSALESNESPRVLRQAGYCYFFLQDYELAAECFKEFKEKCPYPYAQTEANCLLARIYAWTDREGAADEMLKCAQAVAGSTPSAPQSFDCAKGLAEYLYRHAERLRNDENEGELKRVISLIDRLLNLTLQALQGQRDIAYVPGFALPPGFDTLKEVAPQVHERYRRGLEDLMKSLPLNSTREM